MMFFTVQEFSVTVMAKIIQVVGNVVNDMAMGSKFTKTNLNMKGNTTMISNKAMEYFPGLMARYMKALGKKA